MNKFLGLIAVIFFAGVSQGAVPAKTKVTPSRLLKNEGVMAGGIAGGGFTLVDVRRTADAKKKVERIVVDIGDINGQNLTGQPGYFYAEMKKNPSRLVVDFSQMPNSSVNEKKLKQVMKNSLAVRGIDMSLDPIDSSLNLSMSLKPNTKAKVYPVVGKKATSKVVIDLYTE